MAHLTSVPALCAATLLPESWRRRLDEPIRTFNPRCCAMAPDGSGVSGGAERRTAAHRALPPGCEYRVVEGSRSLSDLVQFRQRSYPEIARQWLADPRLYRWDGRIFVYWNSGWHEPKNFQFLQELDPATLAPVGAPRELVLRGERRPLEKNWTCFADRGGALHAIYSVEPHRVLRFSTAGVGNSASTRWRALRGRRQDILKPWRPRGGAPVAR